MRNRVVPGAVAVLLSAALAQGAEASTWCYPNVAACPSGVVGTGTGNVETAAQTNRSDGVADIIYIGAGQTYEDTTNSLEPTGTDALTIQGTGTTSVLTTASTGNIFVVNLDFTGSPAVTLRDLRIVVPASLPDNSGGALQMDGDTLDGVDIDIQNVGSDAISPAIDANTILNTHIYATGSGSVRAGIDMAAAAGNASVLVEGVRIDGGTEAILNDTTNSTLTVRRAMIVHPSAGGISVRNGGDAVVANSVIRINAAATALGATATSSATSTLGVDHVTINKTAGSIEALRATVSGAVTGGASITVTNSIIRGFASVWQRSGGTGGQGSANVTLSTSNFTPIGGQTGNGSVTLGAGNINTDPLFAGASDFHLTAGSPAIDAGGAGTAANDLDDNARVLDGDGDCIGKRDMGAYEFQDGACVAPVLTGSAGNLAVTAGNAAVAVDPAVAVTDANPGTMASAVVTLTNPQAGDELGHSTTGGITGTVNDAKDTVTFTGPFSTAALTDALRTVTFRTTGGSAAQRTVTFRVDDGPLDSNLLSRAVDVTVPASPGDGTGPGTGATPPATTPDATAPVLGGLAHGSGLLAFTLSEAAAVTWRLQVRRPGRKVGKRCVKPTRANRARTRCKRWVGRAASTETKAAGAGSITLPKLRPGVYRAAVIATDAAGNRSLLLRVRFRVRRAAAG